MKKYFAKIKNKIKRTLGKSEKLRKLKETLKKSEKLRKIKDAFGKFRKTRVFSLVKVLLFIAVCLGIGITAAYIHHESDPTEVAVQYFRAFIQQDYKTAGSLLDTSNGCYVNQNQLGKILSKQKEKLSIDQYEIKEPKKEDGKWLVVFKCTNKETGKKTDFKVYLNKFHRGLNPIPVYRVNIDDIITKNYQVTIQKGDRLTLNGEKISEDQAEITTNDDGSMTYQFPEILKGTYQVACENDCGAYDKKIAIDKENIHTKYLDVKYKANQKYQQKIEETADEILQQYYTAVRKKKPSMKKLLKLFPKSLLKDVKKSVKKSMGVVFWKEKDGDFELSEMDISDQKIVTTYNKDENVFDIEYSYQYSYTCQTKTSLINSYTEGYSGKCKSTMKIRCIIDGDKLTIGQFTVKNQNKKNS